MYTLAASGTQRVFSINRQLESLNLTLGSWVIPTFNDNPATPSFLFLMGLWLGDASLVLRIRWVAESSSIWFIPLFVFSQKNMDSNVHLFNMITQYLKSLGVTSSLRPDSQGQLVLSVEGQGNLFTLLWPMFLEFPQFYYWKKHQFDLLNYYRLLTLSGLHLTLVGVIATLEQCYIHPVNFRRDSISYWIAKAHEMFTRKDSKCSLGHYMLQTFNGRGSSAGQVIGVRVVFPKALGSGTKSFSYSKYGAEGAIAAALIYRDTVLRDKLSAIA